MKRPTAKDRYLIKLYRAQGMMREEIGAIINRTVPSIDWIIKRALREGYMTPLTVQQKSEILKRREIAAWKPREQSERKARTMPARIAKQAKLEKKRMASFDMSHGLR